MIWTVVNSKGGTGKTSLALALAGELATQDQWAEVILIDADPQGSVATWNSLVDDPAPFTVWAVSDDTITAKVRQRMKRPDADHTAIIIDAAPRGDDLAAQCILLADLVIIPVPASGLDTWATALTKEQLTWAEGERGQPIPALMVKSRVRAGLNINSAVPWPALPIAETMIHERVAHAEASSQALTIQEWAGISPARREVRNLTMECLNHG